MHTTHLCLLRYDQDAFEFSTLAFFHNISIFFIFHPICLFHLFILLVRINISLLSFLTGLRIRGEHDPPHPSSNNNHPHTATCVGAQSNANCLTRDSGYLEHSGERIGANVIMQVRADKVTRTCCRDLTVRRKGRGRGESRLCGGGGTVGGCRG